MSIIPLDGKEKEENDWDNESICSTETVEVANCSQRLRGFFIRLFVSLLVIGACAGALIWSFVNGEAGINTDIHQRNASVNFSIFVDEYSLQEGLYTVTFRTPDSKNGGLQTPKVYPSFWYQDNTNSRLVHQVDVDTVIYAYKDYSFWVEYQMGNVSSCAFDVSTNYTSYINQLGLTRLQRQHSAIERTHHHKEVFIYDGDPDSVALQGSDQTAFLLTAYADAETGALLGWDTFFTSSSSNDIYQLSYWYDSMLPSSPDPTWFDPPSQCQPSAIRSNRVPK
ncbi:unnamed protein product [Cylicocyclus nassatus]|uniref:Uncharacterized protein n=1 Tax=Cylicocyclus nassatus TaxID=53992 RepID=A0AA36MDE6_CYLNA|nr:unnamed protein product [Cylicocyclus nassatus]